MSCEHYRDLLKNEKLKSTKHRNAILEILERNDLPITAEDLYLKLKESGSSISLSTVYRILETLMEKGIVTKSNMADDIKAFYELNREDHRHHLLCLKCRKIIPICNCPLENFEKLLEERFGFDVKGHKLEVYGHCESCRKNCDQP